MDTNSMIAEIGGLRKDLADNYMSKSHAQKLQDQVTSLQSELARKNMASTPHPTLINEAMATEAAEWFVETSIRPMMGRNPSMMGQIHKSVKDLLTKTPQDLSQYVNSAGGYSVQTSIYPVLEQLFLQSGYVRKFFKMTQMQGKIQLTTATDQGCAVYTGALQSAAPSDTDAIAQTTLPQAASILAPSPLTALYYVSRQLIYNAATNLVSMVFENLAQSNTEAEDYIAFWGDGSSTWGGQYGLANVGANYVNTITQNAEGKNFVCLNTTPASGDALPTLDDLINLTTEAQEQAAAGEDAAFYCNRQVAAYFKTLKASTSGLYFLDPTVNPVNTAVGRPSFMFAGYPVYVINRMSTGQTGSNKVSLTVDSSGAGHYTTGPAGDGAVIPIVAFGSFKKAAMVGYNRGYSIETSLDYQFGNDLLTAKGVEDFGIAWKQFNSPAVAVLSTTGSSS